MGAKERLEACGGRVADGLLAEDMVEAEAVGRDDVLGFGGRKVERAAAGGRAAVGTSAAVGKAETAVVEGEAGAAEKMDEAVGG